MANQLAEASSPYLRQHADNPVDWFQWGEQAFDKAKAEDKPIFLSVGYSSCHWCHVMAHESFEDEATAATLNEHFVPIKVDREERPDIDSVYMGAVQAMTGRGGWPMSVFLTPEGQPFYGGTYWPRDDRLGMPGFPRVLEAVSNAWTTQRDQVEESGAKLTEHLHSLHSLGADGSPVDATVADEAADQCVQAWDRDQGGFGSAPKFPMAMTIDFLLAHHQRIAGAARPEPEHSEPLAAATHTLEAMARGGIYDHVGGGFARYSTDEVWLVPHFEKMLYDNALLLRAYTHAFQITGAPRFRRVAVETADYLVGEMQHPLGGFYSATDADSDGWRASSLPGPKPSSTRSWPPPARTPRSSRPFSASPPAATSREPTSCTSPPPGTRTTPTSPPASTACAQRCTPGERPGCIPSWTTRC
jgi:uncharacterized protein YyaL (SSP411 family)